MMCKLSIFPKAPIPTRFPLPSSGVNRKPIRSRSGGSNKHMKMNAPFITLVMNGSQPNVFFPQGTASVSLATGRVSSSKDDGDNEPITALFFYSFLSQSKAEME